MQPFRPNNYTVIGSNNYYVAQRTPDGKIMELWGTVVPTDTSAGFGVGCIFKHVDGTAGTAVYINEGSATSSDFNAVEPPGSIIASEIAITDAGLFTGQTTIEGSLQEIYEHLLGADHAAVDLPLNAWRIVDADGDAGNIAGIGGVFASDSAPILEGIGTTNANRLRWIANGVERISCTVSLPPDFDGGSDATFQLIGNSAGTTNSWNAAVLVSNWDGGADVVDALTDTANTTVKAAPGAIGAVDIPASPLTVTISITPPAHGTDALHMLGARLLYKRVILSDQL